MRTSAAWLRTRKTVGVVPSFLLQSYRNCKYLGCFRTNAELTCASFTGHKETQADVLTVFLLLKKESWVWKVKAQVPLCSCLDEGVTMRDPSVASRAAQRGAVSSHGSSRLVPLCLRHAELGHPSAWVLSSILSRVRRDTDLRNGQRTASGFSPVLYLYLPVLEHLA